MIRVGIVGFGFMGRMHYQNWLKVAGVEVVAVQDVAIKDVPQVLTPEQTRDTIRIVLAEKDSARRTGIVRL